MHRVLYLPLWADSSVKPEGTHACSLLHAVLTAVMAMNALDFACAQPSVPALAARWLYVEARAHGVVG